MWVKQLAMAVVVMLLTAAAYVMLQFIALD